MDTYIQITLPARSVAGGPLHLPGWLAALNLSPAELADLTERGYPGVGYLLFVDVPLPTPLPGHVVERDDWVIGETTANPRWGMRALTDDERTALTTDRINAVKAEAQRRIYAVAPAWKQANLTARAAELVLLYPGTKGDDLPEPTRTEFREGKSVWDRIKAIRAASGVIELRISANSPRRFG